MLSELERQRLIDRKNQTPRDRANNDVRVKRKLKTWIEDRADVMILLRYLPPDLICEMSSDDAVFDLLDITADIMEKRTFLPLCGKLEQPDTWKAGDRLIKDNDIGRADYLFYYIKKLLGFYGRKSGVDNPLTNYYMLKELYNNPEYADRLKDGERKGIEIIDQALSSYRKPTIEKMLETRK